MLDIVIQNILCNLEKLSVYNVINKLSPNFQFKNGDIQITIYSWQDLDPGPRNVTKLAPKSRFEWVFETTATVRTLINHYSLEILSSFENDPQNVFWISELVEILP